MQAEGHGIVGQNRKEELSSLPYVVVDLSQPRRMPLCDMRESETRLRIEYESRVYKIKGYETKMELASSRIRREDSEFLPSSPFVISLSIFKSLLC